MKIRHLAATATASIALAAGVAAPSVAASTTAQSGHWFYMACGVKGQGVYHTHYYADAWSESHTACWRAQAKVAPGARVAVIAGSYVPRHRIACTLFHNGRVVRHQVRTAREGHAVTVTCAGRA